jgi:hypothetical protein
MPKRVAPAVGLEEALRERVLGRRALDHAREQGMLDGRPDDRSCLERGAALGCQPRCASEDGVPDRGRNLRRRSRDHLGDEERIATGSAVELGSVELGPGGQLPDGLGGQRVERHAPDGRRRRKVADDHAQRVEAADLVVPVGPDDHRPGGLHAATDEPNSIERGLVGPVQVVEDEGEPRSLPQGAEQRLEDRVPRGAVPEQAVERRVEVLRDVGERAEWARRREWIARPDKDGRVPRERLAEGAHEGGLADAGLALQEHEPTLAGRLGMDLPEGRERRVALQEPHDRNPTGASDLATRASGRRRRAS